LLLPDTCFIFCAALTAPLVPLSLLSLYLHSSYIFGILCPLFVRSRISTMPCIHGILFYFCSFWFCVWRSPCLYPKTMLCITRSFLFFGLFPVSAVPQSSLYRCSFPPAFVTSFTYFFALFPATLRVPGVPFSLLFTPVVKLCVGFYSPVLYRARRCPLFFTLPTPRLCFPSNPPWPPRSRFMGAFSSTP